MTLFDIDSLRRDTNQDNLYNLFEPTFIMRSGYDNSTFVVSEESMMRPDLVCNDIYNRVDLLDFILSYNDIDNPLNLMEGDILFYTAFGAIDNFKLRETDKTDTRKGLINANKSTRIDQNRQKYIEEKFALPPTYLPTPQSPITFEGDNLVIGR